MLAAAGLGATAALTKAQLFVSMMGYAHHREPPKRPTPIAKLPGAGLATSRLCATPRPLTEAPLSPSKNRQSNQRPISITAADHGTLGDTSMLTWERPERRSFCFGKSSAAAGAYGAE
jgi:hypothetical protein